MKIAHEELGKDAPRRSLGEALADADRTVSQRRALWGSCLWLDVSGFTAHSDRLARRSAEGIALLSDMLGEFYDGIGSVVSAASGQVVFFAGDGALCFWNAGYEHELAASAVRAAGAALRLSVELGARRFAQEQLEFRIGLSSGPFHLDTVGGDTDAWLRMLTGPSLTAAAARCAKAPLGRALLTDRSAALLGDQARLERFDDDAYLLSGFQDDAESAPPSGVSPTGLSEPALSCGVSEPPMARAGAGEVRRVSVAFCHWDHALTPSFDAVAHAVVTLQRLVREHAGTLCQLVEDDKGVEALVVFGLTSTAPQEQAAHAARFAVELIEQLPEAPLRPRVGLATGPAFCGDCGQRLRQYCVIGLTVIRAARLAHEASEGPLADDETQRASRHSLAFRPPRALELKGLGPPLSVHQLALPRL
jgi:class 3 adenylate cyclase